MMIDELISIGETFELKHVPGHIEPAGYGLIKQVSGYSYLPKADEFATWIQNCIRFMVQNFPEDILIEEFKKIELEGINQGTIYKLVGGLKALKDNPIICKQPQAAPNAMNNITVTQSQTQSQTNSVVMESLKDELKGKQYKEIEEILASNEPKVEKRSKILSKLMEFGEDVAAGIVATLLTKGM